MTTPSARAIAELIEQYDFGPGFCLGIMSDGKPCFKGSFLAKLEALRAALSRDVAVSPAKQPVEALQFVQGLLDHEIFKLDLKLTECEAKGQQRYIENLNAQRKQLVSYKLALAAPSEAIGREWQDIETAPKDGTPILAIRVDWWEPVNGNHRWIFSRIYETYFDSSIEQFETSGLKQPTHWMPLPAGPSVTRPHHSGEAQ